MTKPSDFLLGILDFFAVLMPGAVVTWLAASQLPELANSINVAKTDATGGTALAWVVLLFTSYVLGHFVFMAGSALDWLYDRWRDWKHAKKKDHTYRAAKELYEALSPRLSKGHFTTLKWAKAYVQIHSPAARLEIDRLDANSKFFRSFVLVSLLLGLHYGFAAEHRSLAAGGVLLALLSFWRYCDQRWKSSELSYATAVMLHGNTPNAAATTGHAEAKTAD